MIKGYCHISVVTPSKKVRTLLYLFMASTIFLIEDDIIYAEYLIKSLEQNGQYKVKHFINAEDALQAMNSSLPGALVVDYRLPRMTGIEFFERIKSKMPDSAKVIIISATEDGSLVLSFIQKGVRDYVIKDETVVESLLAILADKEEDYFHI